MDPDKKFGRGSKELTGGADLISQYKLLAHQEFFCKRSLPLSISDSHYLHNVVGDTEIRKGEGMQLNQLMHDTSSLSRNDTNPRIQLFDLDLLQQAFQLRDTTPIHLLPSEKGTPTLPGKSKSDKDKKHKKHKDKDKKHKHRHKDRSKDKDKEKKKDTGAESSKKHRDKKKKPDGDEDLNDMHKHKKSKHKSSKIEDLSAIKAAG